MADHKPVHAPHGGDFFSAIGERFEALGRHYGVINADVLDAWYDPSPRVLAKLQEHLPWLVRTSPPTHGEGLVEAVCHAQALEPEQVLLGAGSSALMYLAFPVLAESGAKVVLSDPMYGEYGHIFGHVLDVRARRVAAFEEHDFNLQLERLVEAAREADLVVFVNPNSPTGTLLHLDQIETILKEVPQTTKLWIDETYIDFFNPAESAESLVGRFPNLIVSKSLSKFYALSGLRAAYLAGSPTVLDPMRRMTPPWSVGLLAQVAAVEALGDPAYYRNRADDTRIHRTQLTAGLERLGLRVFPSVTNFVLVQLPHPVASELVEAMARENVFIRDCTSISPQLQGRYVRIAVKQTEENSRIIECLGRNLTRLTP